MNEIKIIKDSLRIIDSKYVYSKKIDDNSYKITFTYKNRNYSLDINKEYKFMMLNILSSIYGVDFNEDSLELINYIKQMITFTEFEEYNVFTFSLRKEIINDEIHKVLQVITEMNDIDAIIDSEIIKDVVEKEEYKVIEYNIGLNKFDKRLFDENIFDDFNEKVCNLCDEDLYLIYITLISYFYKFANNNWEDEIIDPYIIDDMLLIIYEEIQNRYQDYNVWYNEWSNYFTDENIENYLSDRNKGKSKKLIY